MQAANHANRQTTFAVEHFGDAAAGTDYVFEVFARQARLVQPENYRVHRVLRVGCVVAGLININQYCPHVEPAPSGVSFASAPQRRHVF